MIASRTIEYRTKEQQLPVNSDDLKTIRQIYSHYSDQPIKFEKCAEKICRMMLPDIAVMDLTKPSRDGGRDAIGSYKLGEGPSSVLVEFAMGAKCFSIDNGVGVRPLSRLISRLRHRQFGILVTTSYIAEQAYKEIKEDDHPIVVISAIDIVNLLRKNGIGHGRALSDWLKSIDEYWESDDKNQS